MNCAAGFEGRLNRQLSAFPTPEASDMHLHSEADARVLADGEIGLTQCSTTGTQARSSKLAALPSPTTVPGARAERGELSCYSDVN